MKLTWTEVYILVIKLSCKINYKNSFIPESFWKTNKPFILAFWHNQLMTISFCWKSKKSLNILASTHSDGRFGSIVGNYFNLNNIPITTNRNKFTIRAIYQKINEKKYIGITPDGPRGPKEIVSEGIIKMAKTSKTPIIPVGFWSSNNIKLKSWDSFLITLPFSKCSFVWSEPLEIPNNIDENQIEHYRKLLEKKINQSVKKAQINCQ